MIRGEDFSTQGDVLLMEPGSAPSNGGARCDVMQWTTSEVTCQIPMLTAGVYEVRVRVPFLGDAVVPVPFVVPLNIETQEVQEVNMAGGEELNFSGMGWGDPKAFVTLCGAPCELLNMSSTSTTELRCRTTKMLNSDLLRELPSEDLRPYIHVAASPHRHEEALRAIDGAVDTDVKLSNDGACHIDFDAGPGRQFHLTELAYFAPAEAKLREDLIGASFQAGDYPVRGENYTADYIQEIFPSNCNDSNDTDIDMDTESNDSNGSNRSNCFPASSTLEPVIPMKFQSFWTLGRPSLGWNPHRLEPPLRSRRVRFHSTGTCQIREVELRGQVFSQQCPMQVSFSGSVAALGVISGGSVLQLATKQMGVTPVEEQMLMMPGGSFLVWMRVDTTEQIELQLQATVLENFEPKTFPMPIMAKRIQEGELLSTDFSATFHIFSDTPRMTWSSISLDLPPGLWALEFWNSGTSYMQLGELQTFTAGVDFLVQTLTIPDVVQPSTNRTPIIMSIDPPKGPFSGNTDVLLRGDGFLCNGTSTVEELSVNLSDTPCVVVYASDTELLCRSGPKTTLGGDHVTLRAGCGTGLVAPGVSFVYVSRWSIPADWPRSEPPIPTDETFIPKGSHIFLDLPTEKLSLLRIEGHLELDLTAEELFVQTERLWLRGGHLTAARTDDRSLIDSLLDPNMSTMDTNTNFSFIMGDANLNQVFSRRVEAQGVLPYGLLVTDRFEQESAWAEAHGSLNLRSPMRRSSLLVNSAMAGSKVLSLRNPIDVQIGEVVLVMGGSGAAPERHVVSSIKENGQLLMLQEPLLHHREGGIRQLEAMQEQVMYNFGQVDLSATVASLNGMAYFYGDNGQSGAFIDCLHSTGSCGIEGLVFSSCGQVAPGTAGIPCVNLKALRQPSYAFVKDSVFLDAQGPAVILQAQRDGHLDFSNNVVTSPRGSGITVTVRHDLPDSSSVMVRNNQVVSPQKSDVGLPWFQHQVAFRMATGAASYLENFASQAEACFYFEPRIDVDDLSPGEMSWFLAAFRGNAVHGCSTALLMPTLRNGDSKVFEEFTVFASDYVAFIHACDRCRFLNWKWVECTYGIMDQDSAPLLEDPPWIENITAVGTRDMWGASTVSLQPQITLSSREGRHIRNITFFLFGSSPCLYGGLRPVTIRTEKMHFFQSDVHIWTLSPAGYAIFADLDGSLSGTPGGFVTGDKLYNRHAQCQSVGVEASQRLLCSADILVRAIKITGVEPAELQGTDLTVWSIYGHGTVPYSDGWFFAVVGAKSRADFLWPSSRWAEEGPRPVEYRRLPFWYTLRANSDLDWQQMRVSYGAPGSMLEQEWIGLHFPYSYTPVREFQAVGISGSCFEPYYDWLDRGGYELWVPKVITTITRTSTTTYTMTSTTSSTATSTSTTSMTRTTTSSSITTTMTDENQTFNETNETNETPTTFTTTFTTKTISTVTTSISTTTRTTVTTKTLTTTITTSSTSRTSTSRTSSTTTTSYLGTRTSTSTDTTITMTTTTSSTVTTVPQAAPLRTLSEFPQPIYGCAASSFQFEMCERPAGWAYGPCLPDGPVVGWTNFTEMVNSSLFANGTFAVVFGNQKLGEYKDAMVADLVNTGCGPGGCAFIEEVRASMGPPGNWTRPDSWPGRELPRATELEVVIPPFYHIVYNNFTAIGPVGDVKIFGKFTMAEDDGLKLMVKSIQVFQGGVMEVGTTFAPHRATAIISFWGVAFDSQPAYISTDTEWGRKVFGVYEGNVSLHGKSYSKRWGRLYQATQPGEQLIRVLGDVGDWPIGSEIAITTQEYSNMTSNVTGSERRFIEDIVFYAPSTEILLDRPLDLPHFVGQAFTEPGSPALVVDARVVLLSRSIIVMTEEVQFPDPERGVPDPGHGGNWFGHHMVISGSSFVSMSWVQIAHAGQDGQGPTGLLARFPALRVVQPTSYNRFLPRPYFDSLVFTNSWVGAVEVVGTWGLDLLNCVFCETRGRVLHAGDDMGAFFIVDNLAMDSRPEPPPLDPVIPTYEPVAVFQLQARPVVFSGNVVAGCPDIGVLMRPETCDDVEKDVSNQQINEVHSCVVGFFVLRSCSIEGGGPQACSGHLDCVHLRKLKAWKNSHVGILFVDTPSSMIVSDVLVFDNHIGLTGNFHRQIGDMLHSFEFRDSQVYGSTTLSNCRASLQCMAVGPGDVTATTCRSLPGPEFRRVGILLPIITNRGKTCEDGPVQRTCPVANLPERDCALPWEQRYGNRASRMSSQKIMNVDFAGFRTEDCGMRSVAIAYNPTSRDWNPLLEVSGLRFAETDFFQQTVSKTSLVNGAPVRDDPTYLNTRILLEPWSGFMGEGSCRAAPTLSEIGRQKLGIEGDVPLCPGLQQTWVKDLDGSLVAFGVVLLPPGMLPLKCNIASSSFELATMVPSALPPTCLNCTSGYNHTLDNGLTACSDRMRLLNWESLDPDCCGFYRRELGVLRATRLIDNATEETRPMFDETCPRGLEYGRSTYVIRMEAGYSHMLRFMGSTQLPRLNRIHLFSESVTDEVLLKIPLGRLRRPRLYIFGINFDIMRRTSIPNTGDSHGAMFLDRDNLMLYMMTRGMPGGQTGRGVVILMLLEVIIVEVVIFIPLEQFNEFEFLADVSRSLNVTEDRITLVDIRYDGKKWLEGPNGRRLAMVDTLAIKFEVAEDAVLNPTVLADVPTDSLGSYNPFFEDAVQNDPAEADAVNTMRNLATTLEVRGVEGLNLSSPVADFRVIAVPDIPTTQITRLSCGVNLQGEQVCTCEDGWYGSECDQLCNCTGPGIASCNEGPQGNGTCNCKDGYTREKCDECKQYFYNLENGCAIYCHPDDHCSGHGVCTTDPVTHQINGCACEMEWAGNDCSQCAAGWYPTRVCNVYCNANTTCYSKGLCSDSGSCVCEASRVGQRCEACAQEYYPPGECSRRCGRSNCIRGRCDQEGFCQCNLGWFGPTCSVSCPGCSQEGSTGCDDGREGNGTCICQTGYDGETCSQATEFHTTEWSICDGPCGGTKSFRTRLVRCHNTVSGAVLADGACAGDKPLESEACVTALCSCMEPPQINNSNYELTLQRCPYLQNGKECNAVCAAGYSRTGSYKCESSRYVQWPICLLIGEIAQEMEVLHSYVVMAGIDLSLVVNISSWYASVEASLKEVLASAVVAPGVGESVTPQQITFFPWYEVEAPARRLEGEVFSRVSRENSSRFLQSKMVAIEIPFYMEIADEYTLQKAEQMLNFFAASAAAVESSILKEMELKLEELCFTVLPDLRPMKCTPPKTILIGRATRTILYLPPAAPTTAPPTTTTGLRIIIEVNLQEGLPAWAVAVLIICIVLVGFCASYIYRLRQQKKKLLRRQESLQRIQKKLADDARSDEQKEYDAWMEALTDQKGQFITGYKDDLQLPDGSIYSGELLNGDPHGVGKMIWCDGRTYRGKWHFSQPHGHGVMSSVAPKELEFDTWIYSGQFHEGLRHGTGRCEWPAVGSWYEGDWLMDGEHGMGELGAGATESQDGDPQVWCMYNGYKQENVAQSRVRPGPEDRLMVVVLQAKNKQESELDDVELRLLKYGMSVGNPHVWIPRHEHAFLVTSIEEDGPLDQWNKAQIRQSGPGASIVLPNSTIWAVNGVRGDIRRMTELLVSPPTADLELEVWGPAHLRFDSMRDDVGKRLGWFKSPAMETEYTGMMYQPKSKQAQEQEQTRPWLKPTLAVRDDQSETQSFLGRAPARMTNRPGLPALLRMPEVPAPPSHLVASVTAPKTVSKMESPSKSIPSKSIPSKTLPSKRASVAGSVASRARVQSEPPEPLRWPQAPAPPTPPEQERDERLRRVAEATTPPMSPH